MFQINVSPTDIGFTSVKKPYGWLGNMSSHKIKYDGIVWPTAEHLFQALRFTKDSYVRAGILEIPSPMGAKMYVKDKLGIAEIPPRGYKDVENMEMILRLKLEQHNNLTDMLLGTHNYLIVEDISRRPLTESSVFWGMKRSGDVWQGQNNLGNLWMKIREELQDAKKNNK